MAAAAWVTKPWGQDSLHRELRKCGVRVLGCAPQWVWAMGALGAQLDLQPIPTARSLAAIPISQCQREEFPRSCSYLQEFRMARRAGRAREPSQPWHPGHPSLSPPCGQGMSHGVPEYPELEESNSQPSKSQPVPESAAQALLQPWGSAHSLGSLGTAPPPSGGRTLP